MDRFSALGYLITHWQSAAQVDSSSLTNVDVLFVFTQRASELSSQASTIADWVAQGHGLIVEQPNMPGPVDIMPPGLSIDVWSAAYDGPASPSFISSVDLTPAGSLHPITFGLTTEDFCANADRVLSSDVSPLFQILGVQITNPDYVALAAANYGSGRVVFHTGNTNPVAFDPGSDLYVRRMIDWAAAPEPATCLLVGPIAAAWMFSRSSRCRSSRSRRRSVQS